MRVLPNAEAMDQQLQGADERSKKTYEFIELISLEIFGAPGEFALAMMKKVVGTEIGVSIAPQFISGFMWLKSD